jgi:hypothetical protein
MHTLCQDASSALEAPTEMLEQAVFRLDQQGLPMQPCMDRPCYIRR